MSGEQSESLDAGPATLVERSGGHVGRTHPLAFGEQWLGRGAGATVRIDDDDVSRLHARLDVDFDGMVVTDPGSKNGVVVLGHRIDGSRRLIHGDRLTVGAVELELVHPASQVAATLERAGETTVTTMRGRSPARPPQPSLVIPALGVVVFAALVVALLLS